jgi:microcompartment protein CcmK/EutM
MMNHYFSRCRGIVLGGMLLCWAPAVAHAFDGWQGMRVISLEGRAERLSVADLEGDGRDDIIVVNPRQARIDLYRWLDPDARTRADVADPERPNELPMAPEWTRGEIVIDEMPRDAVAHDTDGDGRPEVLVLTSPSNRIAIYKRNPDVAIDARGAWKKTGDWNLLSGSPSSRGSLLVVRDLPDGSHELLVSFDEGIQRLPLETGARAEWLAPREIRGRLDLALADVDGDGRDDLVEWSNVSRQVIRWHPCGDDGSLLPAQTLHDRPIDSFAIASGPRGQAEFFLLGGSDKGVLRQYRLVRGDASDVGRQEALPMGSSSARRGWCGIVLDGEPAIVAADSIQPRLRVHGLTPSGWSSEQTFPAVGSVKAVVAPRAASGDGLLLLWAKDAADLHRSRWENGRFTYPQPWVQEGKDRKILALDTVGPVTWWAQRVGEDVDLFVWPPDAEEPKRTRFTGLGAKVDKVVWLGDDTLLVQDAYAPAGKLVRLDDGKTVVTSPAILAKANLDEYRLLDPDGVRRKSRITDGVLQWLGDDLHPVDQVMLGEGQKIVSFLPSPPIPGAPGRAWALEKGGEFLHRLAADEAGVMRTVETVKPPTGMSLEGDPVLGVVLVDQERIVRLSRGEPWELQLVESIDGRVGRRSGVRESTIHRMLTTDVDGDGGDDLLLCDDRRHQLTAMLRKPGDEGKPASLERSVSWRVFDDRKYPYDGGDSSDMVSEPRRAVALDADGDGVRDLVLVSQDRLLIYLGRDATAAAEPADTPPAAPQTAAKETP